MTATSTTVVLPYSAGGAGQVIVAGPATNVVVSQTFDPSGAAATAAAALIAGAPAALDTLRELADALGDDPSYAAHIVTQLATKVPLPSGVTPGWVPTVGSDGSSIVYAASAGGGGVTVTDNSDGTLSITSGGSSTVTDNNDGTLTFS